MFKHLFAGCCFSLLGAAANAQTLFTYGTDSVSVPHFLAAYHKNNTGPKNSKAIQEYLQLYIASRLKIKEAKNLRYDTLPQIVSDLATLREQIIPAYLKDNETINTLVAEAALRAQKDIRASHIFIAFDKDGLPDTTAALQRAHGVLKKLGNGESFATIAQQHSDDPAAKTNAGDMGYITVFTLPYAFENVLYATPAGKVATLYKSKGGYHIFKNMGERPAAGRMKAAQILLAFPPDADAATKKELKQLADSLYNRLLKGDNFGKLATAFSNDRLSAAANGQMMEFGIGQYHSIFENAVFSLPKDGAITKPFVTPYGYHIVKRLSKVPPYKKGSEALQEKVERSDRVELTEAALAQKILAEARLQKAPFAESDLWAYTDSILDYKVSGLPYRLQPTSALFTLGNKQETASDWIQYAQAFRYKNDGTGIKPHTQVWEEFIQATALQYYKQHLEQYNPAFKQQIEEFKDGNLFFEIMQREVWNKTQTDTAALQQYYTQHRNNYVWQKSADAVLFYANDAATAKLLKEQLQKTPARWKELAASLSEKVAVDSNRFELSQIPNAGAVGLKAGSITTPVVNATDNTASFAYIIKTYNNPEPRTFAQAKNLVITDYQAYLEKAWIETLKKKYPVTVNEKALADLLK